MQIQRKGYVYRFIDMENQTLYVGKTVNMENRMKTHFSNKSHLAHTDLYEKAQRIEYLTLKGEFDALKTELYYINLYKPRYNKNAKIKDFIDIDKSIASNWKIWRVLKPMSVSQQRQNTVRTKLLPVVMIFIFILILLSKL